MWYSKEKSERTLNSINIHELIKTRESCRDYSDRPVELDLLKKMVDVARMAPSAANTQPWKFHVTNDAAKVKRIADGCQPMERNPFSSGAKAFIVMTAPVDAEPWTPKTPYNHYYRDFDCGSAATHICFAATELGLSTCMIGWFDDIIIKEACGYGDDETASIVFAVGYTNSDKLRNKTRHPLDEVMTVL